MVTEVNPLLLELGLLKGKGQDRQNAMTDIKSMAMRGCNSTARAKKR